MPYRLLNVEDAIRTGNGLKVEPGVRLRSLLGRISDRDVPLPGDLLEIRFPDGGEDRAQVAAFGWEGLDASGGLISLHTDPTDPKFSLVIAGDLPPTAVPRGSEIWLVDYGPARRWNPGRGWDLLAQMARLPERSSDPRSAGLAAAGPDVEPALALELAPETAPGLELAPEPAPGLELVLEPGPVLEPTSAIDPLFDPLIDPLVDPLLRPRRNWRKFWRR